MRQTAKEAGLEGEDLARGLNGQGFKILVDLVLSSAVPLRVKEVPARFRERAAGESKMDGLVMIQFAGLLLDKVFGGLLPLRIRAVSDTGVVCGTADVVAPADGGSDSESDATDATVSDLGSTAADADADLSDGG